MEFKSRISNTFWGLILILCISEVCSSQLMCYVCDDCAEITDKTPQFECNEEFFNTGGSTGSSVQTTTEHAKTTASAAADNDTTSTEYTTTPTPTTVNTEESTTTEDSTTTESKSSETTTERTAETTTLQTLETTHGIRNTTEEQPPSPPTVGPPNTTTAVPTPPNFGTLKPLDDVDTLNNQSVAHEQHVHKDEVEDVDIVGLEPITTKAYKPSAEFRVRQLRSVSDVTFHCFKVQATTANNTKVFNRGCSRVQTMESVCGQWEALHPNEKMNKCYPCSRTICNGSSALSVSVTALIVAAVAVFMHRK